jgi:hypothetical protein
MFSNLVRSMKKPGQLRRISKVLGGGLSVDDLLSDKKGQALTELFDLCEADPKLSRVLANTQLTVDSWRRPTRP